MRRDGRAANALRSISFKSNVNPYAEGSCEVSFGGTKVLCTASLEAEAPRWIEKMGMGWVTAEYGMLPRSTHTRMRREAASGKQGGRTMEIQRLIGRALRAAVPLECLGEVTIRLDCDVIYADGGTRTAAICGGWVALYQAIDWGKKEKLIPDELEVTHIAAVSVGKVGGEHLVDLCYEEDSQAEFDLNLVFNGNGELIEIQGTAEQGTLGIEELTQLLGSGNVAAKEIVVKQREALLR